MLWRCFIITSKVAVLSMIAFIFLTSMYVETSYTSLYEESSKTIPDNLPWYPLVVFGDNRPDNIYAIEYPQVFYRIVDETKTINPFAVIGTGDHTGAGTRQQIDEFVETMAGLENVWVCLGNHDLHADELSYWEERVAPEYYKVDDIPGWRIVFTNSEEENLVMLQWATENMLKNTDRELVLVIHRPLYPDVGHNLWERGSQVFQTILQLIQEYHVRLVLQGHWHGYAAMNQSGTEYVITGGAGAPLYYNPSSVPGAVVVTGMYHYLILTLYPNGTYSYKPVYASYGEIAVDRLNETALVIHNTKLDLWGNSVEIPIRTNITIYNKTYHIVLNSNPGYTIITHEIIRDKLVIKTNSTKWYVYTIDPENPEQAVVYTPSPNVEIELEVETTTTTPSSTPITNTTTIQTPTPSTTIETPTSTLTTPTTSFTTTQTSPTTMSPPTTSSPTITSSFTTTPSLTSTSTTTPVTKTTEAGIDYIETVVIAVVVIAIAIVLYIWRTRS